jgi:hypothetical protein
MSELNNTAPLKSAPLSAPEEYILCEWLKPCSRVSDIARSIRLRLYGDHERELFDTLCRAAKVYCEKRGLI